MCVCVCERECVCVCVCVSEREREVQVSVWEERKRKREIGGVEYLLLSIYFTWEVGVQGQHPLSPTKNKQQNKITLDVRIKQSELN